MLCSKRVEKLKFDNVVKNNCFWIRFRGVGGWGGNLEEEKRG